LAKDLIKKLLKASPQDRLKLEEIEEHPWFRDNPAIKQVKSILSS
jgi:serine/threonine protein kinase